jgi:4-diphosphocytidyl-2C-methyl-D-erythritol kinase
MSGSGSSLFALCRDEAEAERIVKSLKSGAPQEADTFLVSSCA